MSSTENVSQNVICHPPLKYGDYLYVGKRTLHARYQYQPKVEEIKEITQTDIHSVPLEEFVKLFGTDVDKGLTSHQAEELLLREGPNTLTPCAIPSDYMMFHDHSFLTSALLLATSIFCFVTVFVPSQKRMGSHKFDNVYFGIVLLIAIFILRLIPWRLKQRSTEVLNCLRSMYPQFVRVVRDGEKIRVPQQDVVIGDVVLITAGDVLSTDLRIIDALNLEIDSSSLTGNSESQIKSPNCTSEDAFMSENIAFCGTRCISGYGTGVVVATGNRTVRGRLIRRMTVLQSSTTELHSKMCLTETAFRMASKNCLVKNLDVVESLGFTSVICCDKTGIITQNRMTISHILLDLKMLDVYHKDIKMSAVSSNTWTPFIRAAALCSTTKQKSRRRRNVIISACSCDPSEVAIMEFLLSKVEDIDSIRKMYPLAYDVPFTSNKKYHATIHEMKQSENENSSYLLCMKGAPEIILDFCDSLLLDGNEETMDQTQRNAFNEDFGKLMALGERVIGFCDLELPKDKFPLGYTFREDNIPFKGLRFLGLMSMIDPPRPSVPEAIKKCRRSGIKVILLTGDHDITAVAIAREVGIISPKAETRSELAQRLKINIEDVQPGSVSAAVIHNDELEDMDSEDLVKLLKTYQEIVFVRITPFQKLQIVEALQSLGEVVAITGDSLEDAPALRKAEIGLATSMNSCDASQEAADMILLDNNFSSIVSGIEEGRLNFDNLQKSVCYVLIANISEIIPFLLMMIFHIPLPLGSIFILFIDIGINLLPTITLVVEKAESDVMDRKPHSPEKCYLVHSRILGKTYLQIGVIEVLAGIFTYFVIMAENGFLPHTLLETGASWKSIAINDVADYFNQEWTYTARKNLEYTCQTAFFITIVFTQCFSLLISRVRWDSLWHHGMRNYFLNFCFLCETVLAVSFCYIPGMDHILHMFSLKFVWLLMGLPFGFLILAYDELRRYFARHSVPNSKLEEKNF
ncbi:sodium/potassium-transporting ATPase subunit alpha-like isoform X2 [Stegodyphus dumicola]|uniref:sodium/potassium-transporting ATPase subunit alpha-like isoform X2 n=1 Tax=Stegodyphus dumicola TaxID=202533 RepID=UPI0015B29666|nr:sodium/potassium-transporting ATPase subunit alpha-like isoform X2 [Stegodyphus dumicola]